jgi:phage terminase large subunit
MDNDTRDQKIIEYNPVYYDFFQSRDRYAVLVGGAGSAKSFSTAQKILFRTCNEQGHRFLCVRKVADTLSKSIYQLFMDMIIDYGLYYQFKINKSEKRFTHLPTGNEIILTGMDDSEKIKSIAGITGVWCEEATELDESDFNQLELRVRGETRNYKQFIITFNPIDEKHWLKKRFFDIEDDQVFTLKTTYKDNLFLDDDYIRHLTERVRIDENLHRIYVLGEWGKERTGGEFYKQFVLSKHSAKLKYNPDLPLHISFDENTNPYFPAVIFQIEGKKIMLIDLVLGKNPNNTVAWVCREIERKYMSHIAGVFIYGDATSQKDDVKQEKGYDLFKLIINALAKFKPVRRVAASNPSVVMRGNFINTVFQQEFEGMQFIINSSCTEAIDDFMYTKEASDGKKDKKTVKDPKTGITYQPYGHISDATDYLICYAFRTEYLNYERGGVSLKNYSGRESDVRQNRF